MKGIGAYQDTAVATQSRGRLIVMLYDGAIKFLRLAIRELEALLHRGGGRCRLKEDRRKAKGGGGQDQVHGRILYQRK